MAKSMRDVSINLGIVFLITSVVLISDTIIVLCSARNNSHHVVCVESERQALLRLKQNLSDPSNRLFSWVAESRECCEWVGVVCNDLTGYVQELHLRNPFNNYENSLGGTLNQSLLELKHLTYLDLSGNNFDGIQIPSFIGSLGSLRYLNLSHATFGGVIPTQLGNLSNLHSLHLDGDLHGVVPHQLGNLSYLHYLRLQSYGLLNAKPLYAESLQWLSGNSLLEHLDLSWVNLTKASNHWLQVTNILPSLAELHFSSCELHHLPPLHVHDVNFTSLSLLDLSGNRFESVIPDWLLSLSSLDGLDLSSSQLRGPIPSGLRNMTFLTYLDVSSNSLNSTIPDWLSTCRHLEYLDLSFNGFTGRLPRSLENLCNLKYLKMSSFKLGGNMLEVSDILSTCILDKLESLDLSHNKISGQVPESLGRISSLNSLDLSHNNLSGALPESLGQLAHLYYFSVSQNSLEGVISKVHFANLTCLKYLYASGNQFFFDVSPNWVPQFQLQELSLRSWRLGPQFPHWLHSQKNLVLLDISHTGISGTIPRWFWNLSSQFEYLNLSHNHIHGEIVSELLVFANSATIDLSSNHFNGTLPYLSSNVSLLDLSNNSFSGSISHFLCHTMDKFKDMQLLNLERNLLSGALPNCWTSWIGLEFINLRNNHLSGKIPSSMGFLNNLKSLHLQNNSLSGELPLSLQNCTGLVAIDFGENEFSGSIPTWIGERLSDLKILILRSNKFHGHIPKELCALSSLQILDLAHNNFSKSIPACFMNLSGMAKQQNSSDQMSYWPVSYFPNYFQGLIENAILVVKGQMVGYSTILQLVTSMDLSDNNLSGEIPKELMNLQGLRSLNLSYNLLIGRIPKDIGAMEKLEAIDFSMNHLFGEIPSSMSSLTFLSHLNLSYNNLSGKIPSGTQLQSFDAFSFVGNNLCGPPVSNHCSVSDSPSIITNGVGKRGNGFEVDWFYVSMAIGFVVGFWGVVGPFLFNKSWRFVSFQLMDNIWCMFCALICICGHQ